MLSNAEFVFEYTRLLGQFNSRKEFDNVQAFKDSINESLTQRDWVMGQAPLDLGLDNAITFGLQLGLTNSAICSIVSAWYFENKNITKAVEMLNNDVVDSDYPLAKLLFRAYSAGWPTESFTKRREELHPQVYKLMAYTN